MTVKIDGTNGIDTAQLRAPDGDPVAVTIDNDGKVAFPQGFAAVAGQVLQEKFFTDPGNTNATATPFKLTADFTITPKSTNSTIFVSMFFEGSMGLVAGANPIGTFTIRNVDSGAQVGADRQLNASISAGGLSLIVPAAIAASEANAALTARRYALYSQSTNTGSGAAGIKVACSIREVQN